VKPKIILAGILSRLGRDFVPARRPPAPGELRGGWAEIGGNDIRRHGDGLGDEWLRLGATCEHGVDGGQFNRIAGSAEHLV
jgi:hypothetical protein